MSGASACLNDFSKIKKDDDMGIIKSFRRFAGFVPLTASGYVASMERIKTGQ
jgi:hypothetical protein